MLNVECAGQTEILAYHGWGFTAACWQDYETAFAKTTWQSFDRGYFGKPQSVQFSAAGLESCRRVVIAHSYGLHLCPDAVLAQTDVLILLNSFLGFHGVEPRLQAQSQRKLQRMRQAFDQHPAQTWLNFIIKTFAPDPLPLDYLISTFSTNPRSNPQPDRLHRSLLKQDLEALDQTTPNADRWRSIPRILLLTSPDDRILMAPLQPSDLPDAAVTEIRLPHGGHGAPFAQSNYCIARISEFLDF
jgi:pimeloyl-[acyl-carrier protein] methyl ester esterase